MTTAFSRILGFSTLEAIRSRFADGVLDSMCLGGQHILDIAYSLFLITYLHVSKFCDKFKIPIFG